MDFSLFDFLFMNTILIYDVAIIIGLIIIAYHALRRKAILLS